MEVSYGLSWLSGLDYGFSLIKELYSECGDLQISLAKYNHLLNHTGDFEEGDFRSGMSDAIAYSRDLEKRGVMFV